MENPTLKLTVHHCRHQHNQYSIAIEVHDTHVSIPTHSYPHTAESSTHLIIYGMTPEDVMHLGNLIIEQAFKIKGLQEASNADKV